MPSSLQLSSLGEHGYNAHGGAGPPPDSHEHPQVQQSGPYNISQGRPSMDLSNIRNSQLSALSGEPSVEVLTGVPVIPNHVSACETNPGKPMWSAVSTSSVGAPVPELKPAFSGFGQPRPKAQTSKGGHTGFSRRALTPVEASDKKQESVELKEPADDLDDDDDDDDPNIPKDFDPANPPKHLSKDEIRRLRRMISNRESARRSRRRKLEHVQCLDSQISQLQAENHNLLDRLSSMEQRAREAMYENCQLKEEVDALKLQLRACTGKMNRSASLQRVASQEHLAKRRGGIMREPMLPDEAVENCRQESAGCGLFRSLGSYENIVQLQFSSPGVTGS
ncbi:hypothetical protein CYMTET_6909 [Cymbomonas tetramitiformis]|uniref:BZIP domain-containing protein n=1 Tax=Cymbomonas tetramitiformis TaxID=36881 RepID=A0AAE0GWM4_9CHLO|nr:hypothetical protein CYMTET_6909 [Cymbomonas tetramitiformis]